jgi:hypothetical protein
MVALRMLMLFWLLCCCCLHFVSWCCCVQTMKKNPGVAFCTIESDRGLVLGGDRQVSVSLLLVCCLALLMRTFSGMMFVCCSIFQREAVCVCVLSLRVGAAETAEMLQVPAAFKLVHVVYACQRVLSHYTTLQVSASYSRRAGCPRL